MKRAFTAIELVVVLVIITILAIMMLPAFEEAQGGARRVKCLSRVREVGMSMEMFQSAHDGNWPAARFSVNPDAPERPDATGSLALLYPEYAPKVYMFQCPATNDIVAFGPDHLDFLNCENWYVAPDGKTTRTEDQGKGPPRPPSYFYDGGGASGTRIPRDALPSRVVYGDECVHSRGLGRNDRPFWIGENNHPDGGNFLFVDKHVEWLPVQWDGRPWDLRRGVPRVPNPHSHNAVPERNGSGFVSFMDTNVFWDDSEGLHPALDADLAGMMWLDGVWQEF